MKVDRENFSSLLARLKPALRGGSAMPSFANIWFDGEAGTVTAYDGGFGIRLKCESDLECGIPGAALLGLLSTSVLKDVTLEQGKSSVAVKLGKSITKLTYFDLESQVWEFPNALSKKDTQNRFTLGEEFIEALRKVLFVKASSPTRVEHHGVMLESDDGKLFLYTTDSTTLASTFVEVEGDLDRVLLPRLFAEQIVAQSPSGVELFVLKNCIIAKGSDVTFYSNLLDTTGSDDLGKIVANQQEKHSRRVELPAGFEGALARAAILSGKEDATVTLAVERDGLVVSGNYALGELKESLEFEGKHAAVTFRGDAEQIRRGLVHADSFSLTSGSMILQGEPNFLYIVAAK